MNAAPFVNRVFNRIDRLSDIQHVGVLVGMFVGAWVLAVGAGACVVAVWP